MTEPIYVYVVEQGCYSSRGVVGVYASAEAAMENFPITDNQRQRYPTAKWEPSRYSEPDQQWNNGCDWEDALDVTRYELKSAPALAPQEPPQPPSRQPADQEPTP